MVSKKSFLRDLLDFIKLRKNQNSILNHYPDKEIDVHYQAENDIAPFILSLMGVFILIFVLFTFIFSPGKTIARFGIVLDIPSKTIRQKAETTTFLVLLDDGKIVAVRKPKWFVHSKNKTVILQETTSMFLGTKRYSFYNEEKIYKP